MTANRFDARAATWDDDPVKVDRARTVAEGIRATVALSPTMRVLEYGAGTGLLTQELRNEVGHVTLADSSAGMLDVLRAKVDSGVIPDAEVWDLDILREDVPDSRFDLVASVMVLHHMPDLDAALPAFARLVDGDGHLCVVDLEAEDGSFHGSGFDGHNGFDRADLTARLEGTGFTDVAFRPCFEMTKNGRTYGLFLMTARRTR